MCNLPHILVFCALISGVFRSHMCDPIQTTVLTRQCTPLEECDFYNQFEGENITRTLRETLDNEIKNQACGLGTAEEDRKGQPCEAFNLTSTGAVAKFHSNKLGLYVLQTRYVNGRVSYYNTAKQQHLYWMNVTSTEIKGEHGFWMVGKTTGQNSGVLVNYDCDNEEFPANGGCSEGWKYIYGPKWEDDVTITLDCNDPALPENVTPTANTHIPPVSVNCPVGDVDLEIRRPLIDPIMASRASCVGYFKIVHASKQALFNYKHIRLGGAKKEYPYLNPGFRILKRNLIIHGEASNCCWELYERNEFKGRKQSVDPGGKIYSEFKPYSAKQVVCQGYIPEYPDY